MNTEGKVEQLINNRGNARFITSSISLKFNCLIILFDSVGKFDYTGVLVASRFLTVPTLIFPVDCSERGVGFGHQGILPSTK